ncbi:hypothetical protein BYT27DRAFT_7222449 [Phlegmacium glaucopus]|nr:hypothetical protein BYT27DRAFT_7222449 [Phlegmacium glaucopus]
MNWSEKNCPNEKLTSTPVENMEELKLCLKHGLMHAFMTSAFTLWTRLNSPGLLENCKGWQKEKGYDGPRTSNIYDIYQQEVSKIDMSTHPPCWKNFLTTQIIEQELEENDFIFPYIAPNGVIHIKQHMSYTALQGLLTKFLDGTDIMKHYTTHCFHWIRWWGGWAIREHVDTLIKYLVDSLQVIFKGFYESGHGGTLHPIPLDPEKTFMGDHLSLKPVTTEEFFQLKHSISHMDEKLDAIASNISLAMEGVSIPDLGHGPGAWRRAIMQWQEVDPVTNCMLKDWPKHWYTGVMRTVTGSKKSQWQIVFKEYKRYKVLAPLFLIQN